MVPVVKTGAELPQIFTDLRLSDTLYWKEAVVIAEEHASKFLYFSGRELNVLKSLLALLWTLL